MSAVDARRQARLVEASGYDSRTFSGGRVVRAIAGGARRAMVLYILVLDEDLSGEDVVAFLDYPHKRLLDVQPFSAVSAVGPLIVYSRSLSGSSNTLLNELRATPLILPPPTAGPSWGPFSEDAQFARGHLTFGLRFELQRSGESVEVIGLLIGDHANASTIAEEYASGVGEPLAAYPKDVSVFDTAWERPLRNLIIYRRGPVPWASEVD